MVSMLLLLPFAVVGASSPLLRPHDRIVWFGDSVTRENQYTGYLEHELERRYPGYGLSFDNAGENGDTVTEGLGRFDRDVVQRHATVVFINFGLNDVTALGGHFDEAAQHKYVEGLRTMLRRAREHDIRAVLLSPHCIAFQAAAEVTGSPDLQARFIAPLAALAHDEGAFFIDLFAATRPRIENVPRHRARHFIPDGIHPNAAGGRLIGDVILNALKAHV